MTLFFSHGCTILLFMQTFYVLHVINTINIRNIYCNISLSTYYYTQTNNDYEPLSSVRPSTNSTLYYNTIYEVIIITVIYHSISNKKPLNAALQL